MKMKCDCGMDLCEECGFCTSSALCTCSKKSKGIKMSARKVETERILHTRDGKEYRGIMSDWNNGSTTRNIGTRVDLAYEAFLIPNENIARIHIIYGCVVDKEEDD